MKQLPDTMDEKKQMIRDSGDASYLCDNELFALLSIERKSPANLKELSSMKWIQLTKEGYTDKEAIKILAFVQLARRLESWTDDAKPKISSPEDVYRRLYPGWREFKQEEFILLCLDTKNQIISQTMITRGSLNANIVHPREVFKAALLSSAAHIIVSHNHPSGDPTPSREDIEITKKLVETGKIMGIDVLDHVIVGDGRHFSMKDAGYI